MSASSAYGVVTVLETKVAALKAALDPTATWTGPNGATGLNASEIDRVSVQTSFGIPDVIVQDINGAIDLVTLAKLRIESVTKI